MTNGNGAPAAPNAGESARTSNWVLGVLTTLAVALGTNLVQTVRVSGERVAVLESQVRDTRDRLARIEEKLDHLLEKKKGTP
jgi:hypothetical protein